MYSSFIHQYASRKRFHRIFSLSRSVYLFQYRTGLLFSDLFVLNIQLDQYIIFGQIVGFHHSWCSKVDIIVNSAWISTSCSLAVTVAGNEISLPYAYPKYQWWFRSQLCFKCGSRILLCFKKILRRWPVNRSGLKTWRQYQSLHSKENALINLRGSFDYFKSTEWSPVTFAPPLHFAGICKSKCLSFW